MLNSLLVEKETTGIVGAMKYDLDFGDIMCYIMLSTNNFYVNFME